MANIEIELLKHGAIDAILNKPGSISKSFSLNNPIDVILATSIPHEEAAYCAEYQAVYDEFTNKPSSADAIIQNTMVESYVAALLWGTKCDRRNFTAIHTNDAGEAQLDWIDPVNNPPALNINGQAFTPYEGFAGDGATNHFDHQYTPSVDGVHYQQDSASQILYIRTDIASSAGHGTSANEDLKDMYLRPLAAGNQCNIKTNDNGFITGANTDGSGEFINTRTASNVNKLYRNKVAIINGTTISTGSPTHSLYSNAYNNDGVAYVFRADQLSKIAFGAGYTQTDVDNEFDIFKTYLTNYGTQVA